MTADTTPRTTAQSMVADARTRVEHLTPEQVEDEIARGALLVDIRDSDERAEHGSIAGSVHYSRGMLEFYADDSSPYHKQDLDPGRRVILHCMSGGRSALAADMLQRLGYSDVAHMDGGLKLWKQEGRPVEGGRAAE